MAVAADLPALFAISPGRGEGELLERTLPLLAEGGVGAFLLREKQLLAEQRRRLAQRLRAMCRGLGLEFWVSSDLALAAAVEADGVQLAEVDPPPSQVRVTLPPEVALGVSLHRPLRRPEPELRLCRHAFLAPVFATPSKPGATPLGCAGFQELAREIPVPAFALGGIEPHQLPTLAVHGIRRVAAIRLFFESADPRETARAALRTLQEEPR